MKVQEPEIPNVWLLVEKAPVYAATVVRVLHTLAAVREHAITDVPLNAASSVASGACPRDQFAPTAQSVEAAEDHVLVATIPPFIIDYDILKFYVGIVRRKIKNG